MANLFSFSFQILAIPRRHVIWQIRLAFKLIPVIFITIIFIKNENKTIVGGKQTENWDFRQKPKLKVLGGNQEWNLRWKPAGNLTPLDHHNFILITLLRLLHRNNRKNFGKFFISRPLSRKKKSRLCSLFMTKNIVFISPLRLSCNHE